MNIYDFTNSKMFDAFIELNRQMIERDLPKRQLIVVGGFALMIHQIRDKKEITDIDYVDGDLSYELIPRIGLLEKWYLYAVPVDV